MWRGLASSRAGSGRPRPAARPAVRPGQRPGRTLRGSLPRSTTTDDGRQLVVQGLALAGAALLAVTDAGVYIERTARTGVFLPSTALRGARLDSGTPGSLHGTGGFVVVTWAHERQMLDTGFRVDLPRRHTAVVDAVDVLAARRRPTHDRPRNPGGRPMSSPAILVLEDGRTFHGTSYGAAGETFGEAVFCTGHDRLPGDPHRPQLPPTGRRHDGTAHREHRGQRRGPRVRTHLGQRLRRPRPGPRDRPAGVLGAASTDELQRPGRGGHQRGRHPRAHPAPARPRSDARRRLQRRDRPSRPARAGCSPARRWPAPTWSAR